MGRFEALRRLDFLREKNRIKFSHSIKSARQLQDTIKGEMMRMLGTNYDIKYLLQEDGQPDTATCELLANWFTDRALSFAEESHIKNDPELYPDDALTDLFYGFFRIYFYAVALDFWPDRDIQTMIEYARAMERSADLLYLVLEPPACQPPARQTPAQEKLHLEAFGWCQKHTDVPLGFARCVLAAVCVFVGVLPDPLEADKDKTPRKGSLDAFTEELLDVSHYIALACTHSGIARGFLDLEYDITDDLDAKIAIRTTRIMKTLYALNQEILDLQMLGMEDDDKPAPGAAAV